MLLTEGSHRLTTTRVAERAGVSVGALYHVDESRAIYLVTPELVAAWEMFCLENRHFPPCDICGTAVRFKFTKPVEMIADDDNFQGPTRNVVLQ